MDQTAAAATDAGRIDALDQLIGQERELTGVYEARQSAADAVAAAALTGVLGLAALTATLAKTNGRVDRVFAWVIVSAMLIACLAALTVRSLAGLQHTDSALLSSGSTRFDEALIELRRCGALDVDPVEVRRRILNLSRARAADAHRAAQKKARGAGIALAALTLSVALTSIALLTA